VGTGLFVNVFTWNICHCQTRVEFLSSSYRIRLRYKPTLYRSAFLVPNIKRALQ
jgi:hypothetical protein